MLAGLSETGKRVSEKPAHIVRFLVGLDCLDPGSIVSIHLTA